VQAALSGFGNNVQITVEPHLTSAKLRALLREGFHVWHFIGHGGVSRDGLTSVLHFEDATVAAINRSASGIWPAQRPTPPACRRTQPRLQRWPAASPGAT
jgi:hypothetical protein